MEIKEIYESMGLTREEADQAYQEFKKALKQANNPAEVIKILGLKGEKNILAFLVGTEVAKAEITTNAFGTFKDILSPKLRERFGL